MEKANHIDDSEDGGSNDETSNHVRLEECLMTTNFSDYLMSVLQFNLVKVEIRELRPEVIAERT